MGLPFFGELLTFLFYFKVLHKPDDFINSKRRSITAFLGADKGTVVVYDEVKKMVFENTAKLFFSCEPGPLLDTLVYLFEGMVKGTRAQPINFPGTAYYHALKEENIAVSQKKMGISSHISQMKYTEGCGGNIEIG
ncbi:Ent-kaurenoic acid oxidase [Quillaja saponaria]|uniref:Ent-kaurenoic acid oxidase n=1 Tax=Quillaja saponaria TaxID=32244 RepID=A0AAD7L1G3_QUISA|nr:Ent-kaurenoic acid oxidase [Quillaja saponaria]